MRHATIAGMALALLMGTAASAKAPDTLDGLVRVKSKKLEMVYLLPDADFRTYTKVMIDTPQVAFKKDWKKDYNNTTLALRNRVDDQDVRRAIDAATSVFAESLAKEYAKAGYQVATAPGPDVVRVSTAIVNISVVAPDLPTAGRSATFSEEAGEATLVLEARDSVSGSLLGRALDREIAGDGTPFRRDSVSNRADFERLFDGWAKAGAKGLTTLKAYSPIDTNGALRR